MKNDLLNLNYKDTLMKYPYVVDFFRSLAIEPPAGYDTGTIIDIFKQYDGYELEEKGIDKDTIAEQYLLFMDSMEKRFTVDSFKVESITIVGGENKSGEKEDISLKLRCGDVVSIVGPTGSGKSRLLADIEWLAREDTPTKRKILINDKEPPMEWRFSLEHKLVAQLSQNMNFVMDLSVGEFIEIHMKSRMIHGDFTNKKSKILSAANQLAGEPLYENTPITALSGGQSRALMIADTAYLSTSPIVLIDEIENAGINRKTAVDLLIQSEKIVLIATHDPVLALRADRRIVIKNGGIYRIYHTAPKEKLLLEELEELNTKLMNYRELIKSGAVLE